MIPLIRKIGFSNSRIVIMFHDIHSVDWFRSTLDTLSTLYRMISAEELEAYYYDDKPLKNCCHITFDDGHHTFYKNAFPVLKEKNIPASIFVSPQIIRDKKNFWFQDMKRVNAAQLKKEIAGYLKMDSYELDEYPLTAIFKCLSVKEMQQLIDRHFERHQIGRPGGENMSVAQLLEIHQSGLVAIGAHTLNHPILKNETDDKADFEITASIEQLSDILGEKVRYFAYPDGYPGLDFGEREINLLKQNGIRLCFSTQKKGFDRNDNCLAIPRNGLDKGGKSFLTVKLLLGKHWYQLKKTVRGTNEILQRKELNGRLAR